MINLPVAKCRHAQWKSGCQVVYLENIDRYFLEVCIVCKNCESPMRFIGLPTGFMLNLPTCSADGTLASLPCHPADEMMPEERIKREELDSLVVDGNIEEH